MDSTSPRTLAALYIVAGLALVTICTIAYASAIARAWDLSWWWALHATGSDNPAGVEYGAWSGFLSDLGEAALIGGLAHLVHQHNCGVKGCWRVGAHAYDHGGIVRKVCRKHHPHASQGVSHEELLSHARANSAAQASER